MISGLNEMNELMFDFHKNPNKIRIVVMNAQSMTYVLNQVQ